MRRMPTNVQQDGATAAARRDTVGPEVAPDPDVVEAAAAENLAARQRKFAPPPLSRLELAQALAWRFRYALVLAMVVVLTLTTYTAEEDIVCSKGYWCHRDRFQFKCPPGRYGATEGLLDANCSGACLPGWYCPSGEVNSSPRQLACPPGFFCGKPVRPSSSHSAVTKHEHELRRIPKNCMHPFFHENIPENHGRRRFMGAQATRRACPRPAPRGATAASRTLPPRRAAGCAARATTARSAPRRHPRRRALAARPSEHALSHSQQV